MNTRKSSKREKILETLKKSGLISAEDLHAKLDNMDLATIYRNLKKFVEEGIVNEVQIKKSKSLYEFVHDDHQHFICTNCEKIRKIKVNQAKLLRYLHRENPWLEKYAIEDIELNVKGRSRGRCKK